MNIKLSYLSKFNQKMGLKLSSRSYLKVIIKRLIWSKNGFKRINVVTRVYEYSKTTKV
jgi:hypothetical protein